MGLKDASGADGTQMACLGLVPLAFFLIKIAHLTPTDQRNRSILWVVGPNGGKMVENGGKRSCEGGGKKLSSDYLNDFFH